MAAVAAKYPAFQELGAEVLTISVDSVDRHRKWEETVLSQMIAGGVQFPMISDSGGIIGRTYGVYDEKANTDQRGRFIVDPKGVVQSVEITCDALGRNITEVLRQLRALRRHEETGDWMPCGWEPGKPTLHKEEGPRMPAGVPKGWKTSHAFS